MANTYLFFTRSLYIFLALVISMNLSFAQHEVLINKKISNLNGNPSSGIEWSASTTNLLGHVITTGHDVISTNQTNLLLTKHNGQGQLLWEISYNTGVDSKNYGIALTIDNSDNIIVIGTTNSLLSADQDYLILKYGSLPYQVGSFKSSPPR